MVYFCDGFFDWSHFSLEVVMLSHESLNSFEVSMTRFSIIHFGHLFQHPFLCVVTRLVEGVDRSQRLDTLSQVDLEVVKLLPSLVQLSLSLFNRMRELRLESRCKLGSHVINLLDLTLVSR